MKRRKFLKLNAGSLILSSTAAFPFVACSSPEQSTHPNRNGKSGYSVLKVKEKSKPYYDWTIREILPLRDVPGFVQVDEQALSIYGGNKDIKLKSTGFFRTEKIKNKWWMIDPDGHPYISVGYNGTSAQPDQAEEILSMLRETGVNALGGWSDWEKLRKVNNPLPYPVQLGLMRSFMASKSIEYSSNWKRRYPNLCVSVFEPDFEEYCHKQIENVISRTRNDSYCIGYYSDNELPFLPNGLDRYLELPSSDSGHKAARKWLKETRGKDSLSDVNYQDRMEFMEFMADRYYSICSKAIKQADPNHLYLGSRIHGYDISLLTSTTSKPLLKASGRYVDVLSINIYGTIGLTEQEANRFLEWAGKPFHVTEFYAKGMDSGLENIEGAGQIVPTQEERGEFYQHFTIPLIKSNACVGWHWHSFMDPGSSSNKGLVNRDYKPYEAYRQKVKELNRQMYALAEYLQNMTEGNLIVKKEESLLIYRNGFPFFVKGQFGIKDLDRLIDNTGNSIRIRTDYSFDLNYAEKKGISVTLEIDTTNMVNALNNSEEIKLQSAVSEILDLVKKYKDHPAILFWAVGEEMELKINENQRINYWEQLNTVFKEIKETDPYHPVMTILNVSNMDIITELAKHVPQLDVIGLNAPDFLAFRKIPEKMAELNCKEPYVVTEYMRHSDCDILNAPFKEPIWIEGEPGNVEERAYRDVILNQPQCLGLFVII
ncbi:MAG: hypothetical protein MUC93_13805 [Bacteroidales bacterium]|jgi:hypothetical protein|nr:hypothetical protein [Bacteroidales bacterium]